MKGPKKLMEFFNLL